MTWKNTIIIVALMLCTMALLAYVNRPEQIAPNRAFATFPKTIGDWQGKEGRFDPEIYNILGVDDSYLANYHSPDHGWVNLYIGFYQSQKEGDLIHSPKNCMPGGGWDIVDTAIVSIDVPGAHGGRMKAIQLVLQNGMRKQIALYWYQSRGRIITSEIKQKLYLVWDSITRHRTDGSFVRLIAPVATSDKAALATLSDFVRQLYPLLQQYIPS